MPDSLLVVGGVSQPVTGARGIDIVLSDPEEAVRDDLVSDPAQESTATTRRIVRAEIVPNNLKDKTATVKACLMHQRRGAKAAADEDRWEDADSFDLRTLTAGQQIKLQLSCGETKRLYQALAERYRRSGGYQGEGATAAPTAIDGDDVRILRGRERRIIEQLLEQEGEGFWDHIEVLQPNMVEAVAAKRQLESRRAAVAEFEDHLERDDWDEPRWQKFFEDHTWIFGHNLVFQFVKQVGKQAYLGGATLKGTGGQRTDMLMATEAAARFTVIVDIKRPDTALVDREPYRNRVYPLGSDLTGGASQVQSYCRTWVTDGSLQEDNRAELEEQGISSYEPKGILVIGHLAQLDNRHNRETFELFRRNLRTPEVITYDELLARARYTVAL